jgi:glycosyltransferase involved in cell wall biosynthesis
MSGSSKKTAVIPCFNEEKTIGNIVEQCLKYVDEVVVSDDQSTDRTVAVAMQNKAIVYQTSGEHGPGKAYRMGIEYALRRGADIIVTLDGDGQHDPKEISKLLKQLEKYDMVITSRFMDDLTHMPFYRRVGIWLITVAYNFGSQTKIKDSQCGLRAAHASLFNNLHLEENGFGYSVEMLVKARAYGYRIVEIPTTVKYHKTFKENSSSNPIKHGLQVLFDTIKWRIRCEIF